MTTPQPSDRKPEKTIEEIVAEVQARLAHVRKLMDEMEAERVQAWAEATAIIDKLMRT
jgi:hypothetical protein